MNLPEGFSVFGQRNARELTLLRAENAFMRNMVGVLPVADPLILALPPAKTVTAAVDSVVNGTPVTLDEVTVMVNTAHPHLQATRLGVYSCLRQLTKREKLVKVGERAGVMFTRAAVGLCLCLLIGCSTPKFSQPAPLRQSALPTTGSAHLQWSPWLNMKTYHVHFGLDFNSQTNVLVTGATNCTIPGLQPGPYFYAVRASDGRTYTPFYETGRFTVASKTP